MSDKQPQNSKADATSSSKLPSGPLEWHRYIRQVKGGHTEPALSSGEVFEAVLAGIGSKDELVRLTLLTFLEEFSEELLFSSERFGKCCAALLAFLIAPSQPDSNYATKAQIAVTLTSIIVMTPDKASQVSVIGRCVSTMLLCVQNVNSSVDRALRATVCECLREIERSFPGIFSHGLRQFRDMCQLETTHAYQAYTLLFATVLTNALRLPQTDEAELFKSAVPLVPFVFPSQFVTSQEGRGPPASTKWTDAVQKEVGLSLTVLLDVVPLLSSWALTDLLSLVHHIAPSCPDTSVLEPLYRLLFRKEGGVVAHITGLILAYPVVFSMHMPTCARRLKCLLSDISMPAGVRQCISPLLFELLTACGANNGLVSTGELIPSIFDPIDVMTCRLSLSVKCLAAAMCEMPRCSFVQVLQCFEAFVYMDPDSAMCKAYFSGVLVLLSSLPSLSSEITSALKTLVLQHPRFIPSFTATMALYSASVSVNPVVLEVVEDLLVHFTQPEAAARLPEVVTYLPYLLGFEGVDPCFVIKALLCGLDARAQWSERPWLVFDGMLQVCRHLLQHYPPQLLLPNLLDLLDSLAAVGDVHTQDSALYYASLLRRTNASAVATLLSNDTILNTSDARDAELNELFPAPTATTSTAASAPPLSLRRLHRSYGCTPFVNAFTTKMVATRTSRSSWHCTERGVLPQQPKSSSLDGSGVCCVSTYLSSLRIHQSPIPVPLLLSLSMPQAQHGAVCCQLYAVVVRLKAGPYVEDMQPVRAPYLFQAPATVLKNAATKFPYVLDFELPLMLRLPVPCSLEATVECSDEGGLLNELKASTLPIRFQDIILPFVSPPDFPKERQLARELWHSLGLSGVDAAHIDSELRRRDSATTATTPSKNTATTAAAAATATTPSKNTTATTPNKNTTAVNNKNTAATNSTNTNSHSSASKQHLPPSPPPPGSSSNSAKSSRASEHTDQPSASTTTTTTTAASTPTTPTTAASTPRPDDSATELESQRTCTCHQSDLEAYLSIKVINQGGDRMRQHLLSTWQDFLLPATDLNSDEIFVPLFLPPFYHLLLLFTVGPTTTRVDIRSDLCTALACVDELLDAKCVLPPLQDSTQPAKLSS